MSSTAIQHQILAAFNFRHACKVFDSGCRIPDDQFDIILEAHAFPQLLRV